jgi:hypothetical protein
LITILIEVPGDGSDSTGNIHHDGDPEAAAPSSSTSAAIKAATSLRGGSILAAGTGFVKMEFNPILLTILNITQLPSLVVIDTTTGRPLSGSSSSSRFNHHTMVAIEYNDPDSVIQAWKQGKSGISCCQSIWVTATCQDSACVVS